MSATLAPVVRISAADENRNQWLMKVRYFEVEGHMDWHDAELEAKQVTSWESAVCSFCEDTYFYPAKHHQVWTLCPDCSDD